jgi:hypothetical protein
MPRRAERLLQPLWLFRGRQSAFEFEEDILQAQHQFLAFVPFLFAEAAKLKRDALHRPGELVHLLAQVGDGLPGARES